MKLVPQVQIRANSIISYTLNEDRHYGGRSIQSLLADNLKKPENKPYCGRLSYGAKKRLRKAVDLFVQVTERDKRTITRDNGKVIYDYQFSFLTLTIHSTDRMISSGECQKKCLEPFIKWLRQVHNVRSYIQKAELQQRGQIHYHLTIDQFIEKVEISKKWNALIARAGYSEEYFKVYSHYNLPSTKIEVPEKVANLGEYLEKKIIMEYEYRLSDSELTRARKNRAKLKSRNRDAITGEFLKDKQNLQTVGGKVWDCSVNLKQAKYFTIREDHLRRKQMDAMQRDGEVKIRETKHCYIYEFLKQPANMVLKSPFYLSQTNWRYDVLHIYRDQYLKHLEDIFFFKRKSPVRKKYPKEIDYTALYNITAHRKRTSLSLFDKPIPIVNIHLEPYIFCSS